MDGACAYVQLTGMYSWSNVEPLHTKRPVHHVGDAAPQTLCKERETQLSRTNNNNMVLKNLKAQMRLPCSQSWSYQSQKT